jgi:hypothetical protein
VAQHALIALAMPAAASRPLGGIMSEKPAWWPPGAEELSALRDEIANLQRAGLPLSEGLREVAQDQPEPLSEMALWLAARLDAGFSLEDCLLKLAGAAPPE